MVASPAQADIILVCGWCACVQRVASPSPVLPSLQGDMLPASTKLGAGDLAVDKWLQSSARERAGPSLGRSSAGVRARTRTRVLFLVHPFPSLCIFLVIPGYGSHFPFPLTRLACCFLCSCCRNSHGMEAWVVFWMVSFIIDPCGFFFCHSQTSNVRVKGRI